MDKKIYSLGFRIGTELTDMEVRMFEALFHSCLRTISKKIDWQYDIRGNLEKEILQDDIEDNVKYKISFTMEKLSDKMRKLYSGVEDASWTNNN